MTVSYSNQSRNYCIFDDKRINNIKLNNKESLNSIKSSLDNPKSKDEIVENLYTLNLMLDEGRNKKEVAELYPVLSKYNKTTSADIQTFLAGIYRKTKIPDAFGPLVAMLIRNSINPNESANFDPNEEIGGAILDYLA